MSSPEMKRRIREREEQMASNVSEYYDLYSNGIQSYFEYDTTIQLKEVEDQRGWWGRRNDLRFTHAKNLQNGNVTIRSDVLPDTLCRSVNFKEKYDWEIAEGEKVFAKLRCQKAYHITEEGDSIVVWFTPSIPVMDGPEDFAGTPGLIMAVEAPAFNYIAESVELGDFSIPKQTIAPAGCLKESAFREKVRDEMIRRYINREE